ncbi:MCM loader [Schizosaccharomyces osmophilus]|uniref:Cell division control protein n=1 Tax=Schizosaccharomyces osmophilus TaxID=2545709 RepID=A0AAE9W9L3_9SCHI|nr:MCM loader [Schizosaccharomyces osmophilus]WBW71322.1 MCM loader [Schizosaccharomyces osmophilus]
MNSQTGLSELPERCLSPSRRSNRIQSKQALGDCTNETQNTSFAVEVPSTPRRKRIHEPFLENLTPPKKVKCDLSTSRNEEGIDKSNETGCKENTPPDYLELPSTPKTPRTPRTPRHTIQLVTPRSLNRMNKSTPFASRLLQATPHRQIVPPTPSTPSTPSAYNPVKTCLRKSHRSTGVVGREKEKHFLESFFNQNLADEPTGAALYISGAPGTGKTVLVSEVLQGIVKKFKNAQVCNVNCMTITEPRMIFERVYSQLFDKVCTPDEEDSHSTYQSQLKEYFTKNHCSSAPPVILVLDEMDHLIAREQQVLYTLFEWPSLPMSRLILVGIANALDMTDRFLPRLQTKNILPTLLPFTPYSAQEISSIIKARLGSAFLQQKTGSAYPNTLEEEKENSFPSSHNRVSDEVPFIHPSAIELCARKVAASSGDLRKALDICRHAIELVEREQKSRGFDTFISMDVLPRASIAHVVRATSALSQSASSRLKDLSLQQKAILCTLVVCNKSLSISDVYEKYSSLCLRDKLIHPLTSSEFCDVMNSLDALSIIRLRSKQRSSRSNDRFVNLLVPEMDIITAVGGIGTLKRFFDKR